MEWIHNLASLTLPKARCVGCPAVLDSLTLRTDYTIDGGVHPAVFAARRRRRGTGDFLTIAYMNYDPNPDPNSDPNLNLPLNLTLILFGG